VTLSLKLLPNVITIGRLIAVPAVVWLFLIDKVAIAFWVFVGAGISDAIDGYLARRLNARSVLGSYLDPLADKLLLIAVFLLLGRGGFLPIWLVILIVARDAALLGVSSLVVTKDRETAMRPLMISKLNTVLQILLAGLMLARLGFGFPEIGVGHDILVYAVAVTTTTSGVAYLWRMHVLSPTGAPPGGDE
jgi:cardiolipin synthase